MKKQTRRKFAAAFKAKVALEAVKNQQTLAELAKKFEVNPIMISRWKAEFLANMGAIFEGSGKASDEPDIDTQELYAQIFENADAVIASYPDVMPKAGEYQKDVLKIKDYYHSGDLAKSRVDSIVSFKAIPSFLSSARGFGTQKGGWSVSYVAGKFGDDILARDIINYGGLWANSIQEAIYFVGLTDSNKQLLNGSNQYEIRFAPDALPDSSVNAFWSVSLYSVPDYRVVDNLLKRYNLNNISGLKKNKDGSVSIWLSSTPKADESKSNWLPTPNGKGFALTMRMYAPKPDVIDGKWFPPAITKID